MKTETTTTRRIKPITIAPKTEEKTAHTPGPWKTEALSYGGSAANIRNANRHLIVGPRGFHEKNLEANARLIAAAPEMLEALRNLVMDWERVIGPIPENHEAQVAIAKAEGGAA